MRGTFTVKTHRLLANRFHFLERRLATLFADYVTQQSPQQAGVGFERRVFIFEIGSRR